MPDSSGSGRSRQLGPFALEEELGRGAMGVVFRARGPDGSPVALKLLTRPGGSPRLEREARALLRLRHPHLVRLIGAGKGPPPWVAMELVEGESLEALLQRQGRLPPGRAARVVGQVALALAHVHAEGLLHRDVKPANVLLRSQDGDAVLSDFGLALDPEEDQRLTRSGALLGTPATMSPEQLRAERAEVGPPSDVWALGATLYRCLTGSEPFPQGDLLELMTHVASGRVRPPRAVDPRIPTWLEAVCLDCLRTDPQARPPAQEVAERLLGPARRPLPGRRALLALAVAALTLGGLLGAFGPRSPEQPAPTAAAPLQRLVLRPGSFAGQDTFVQDVGLYKDDGFGADVWLQVGARNMLGQTGDYRAFLRFDLRALPPQAGIETARLELDLETFGQFEATPPRTLRLRVQRVMGPWTEGSSGQDQWLDGIAWAPPNPLYLQPPVTEDEPPLAELELDGKPGLVSFDLTGAVRAWAADPARNFGVRLAHADEGPPWDLGTLHFCSSDHPRPERRPRLVVEYAGPPPADPQEAWRAAELESRRAARALLEQLLNAGDTGTLNFLQGINQACSLAPGWSRPFLLRASVLLEAGIPQLALLDLQRAVTRDLEPEDEPPLLRVLCACGHTLLDKDQTQEERLRHILETLATRGVGQDDPELKRLVRRVE